MRIMAGGAVQQRLAAAGMGVLGSMLCIPLDVTWTLLTRKLNGLFFLERGKEVDENRLTFWA